MSSNQWQTVTPKRRPSSAASSNPPSSTFSPGTPKSSSASSSKLVLNQTPYQVLAPINDDHANGEEKPNGSRTSSRRLRSKKGGASGGGGASANSSTSSLPRSEADFATAKNASTDTVDNVFQKQQQPPMANHRPAPSTPARQKDVLTSSTVTQSPVVDIARVKSAQLSNVLDLVKLQDIYQEFKLRYPQRYETHLQAVVDALDEALAQAAVLLKPFGARSFELSPEWVDGLYLLFPKKVREWLESVVEQYDTHTIEQFLLTSVVRLIDQQKQVGGQSMLRHCSGLQFIVQFIVRNERARLDMDRVMGGIAKHQPGYSNNPSAGNTLLWLLAQPTDAHPMDLVVWLKFFAPAFDDNGSSGSASSSFQGHSLEWIGRWAKRVDLFPRATIKATTIPWPLYERLLMTAYSSHSPLVNTKKGMEYLPKLQALCEYLRAVLINREGALITFDFDESFQSLLILASTRDDILAAQVCPLVWDVLGHDYSRGFEMWWSLFPKHISETAAILAYASQRPVRLPTGSRTSTREFKQFLHRVARTTGQWIDTYKGSPADRQKVPRSLLTELNRSSMTLERKLTNSSGRPSLCKRLFYLILSLVVMAVVLPAYCDERAPKSELFLAPNGRLCEGVRWAQRHPTTKQVLSHVPDDYWMSDISYYRKVAQNWAVEKSAELVDKYPQLEVVAVGARSVHDHVRDAWLAYSPQVKSLAQLGWAKAYELRTEMLETYLPRFGKFVEMVKETSTEVYFRVHHWLESNVLKQKSTAKPAAAAADPHHHHHHHHHHGDGAIPDDHHHHHHDHHHHHNHKGEKPKKKEQKKKQDL